MPSLKFISAKLTSILILLCLIGVTLGQLTGIFPDSDQQQLNSEKQLSESLAFALYPATSRNDHSTLTSLLNRVISENQEIFSVAVHMLSGDKLRVGPRYPDGKNSLQSTLSTHEILVPIGDGRKIIGTLTINFLVSPPSDLLDFTKLAILALSVLSIVLLIYLIFSGNLHQQFNTTSIIPERVRSAFNALSEGLVILDENHRIVLTNESFNKKVGQTSQDLIGTDANKLNWRQREGTDTLNTLPWHISLNNCERVTGIPVRLELNDHIDRAFSVNSTPIFDHNGHIRGVLATFDDMTELEKQYRQLKSALFKLSSSEKALRNKTIELEFLATRDSLTGCLNRRAFFNKFDQLFDIAKKHNRELIFMMVDIDRFKYINDNYGHANGDKVIKYITEILSTNSRPEDVVGRYGGDEFTIVLPDATIQQAQDIAERLRMDIQQKCHALFTNPQTVTTSFGMAALRPEMEDSILLINNADAALYEAKQRGRNCIVTWNPNLRHKAEHTPLPTLINMDSSCEDKSDPERHLKPELQRLEEIIRELDSELEYTRKEIKRREGKDDLTGLPNKLIFNDRVSQELARCERMKQSTAIISLDVDNFSRINEALGYSIGNQILKTIAERLVIALRKSDTIAVIDDQSKTGLNNISRLNKDEFALILGDVTDIKSVTWVAKRILSRLKKPIYVDNQELYISFNMGVALYPYDDDMPNELLQKAIIARHAAKKDPNTNSIRFFSKEINRKAFHSIWLETQLQKAILRQQFELVYQPKINIQTGHIVGMEALARWPHPKVGLIPPSEFIPAAEHTGLINKLGLWIFKRACSDLRKWHKLGFTDLHLSVNLSAVQLRDTGLSEKFLRVCQKRKIPASKIDLEITESTLIENFEQMQKIITKLHMAGVSFALDDFGMGFSSLSYLQKLPISSIKIDRSFLNSLLPDQQTQAIVSTIISLAKSLDLKVVAEGVETESQRQVLQHLECDEIQGTLFSPPVTVDEAATLLQQCDVKNPYKRRLGGTPF
ncbi:MAG: diguanylate cyclase [Candidatus Thiodiazotropha sp.]|jgi:diguanylate cyclase (GGDEF)-like protein/PAS domain S-box-containing protein